MDEIRSLFTHLVPLMQAAERSGGDVWAELGADPTTIFGSYAPPPARPPRPIEPVQSLDLGEPGDRNHRVRDAAYQYALNHGGQVNRPPPDPRRGEPHVAGSRARESYATAAHYDSEIQALLAL